MVCPYSTLSRSSCEVTANAQPLASYNKSGTAKEKFADPITSWSYQKLAYPCEGHKTALATNLPAWTEPST